MTIEELLDRLFTSGSGEVADRLVLTSKRGRDLGGWCRAAVRDQILKARKPFYDGQRVKMMPHARVRHPRLRSYTGIVCWVADEMMKVERDGVKNPDHLFWHITDWEPVPAPELVIIDEVCEQLVNAYLAGELNAAFGLADRLIEVYGTTGDRASRTVDEGSTC